MLWMVIVGLAMGLGATMLMAEREPVGVIVTIFVGIAGSVVPGILGPSIGWYRTGEPAGIVGSVLGSLLLLIAYRAELARESTGDSLPPAKPASR